MHSVHDTRLCNSRSTASVSDPLADPKGSTPKRPTNFFVLQKTFQDDWPTPRVVIMQKGVSFGGLRPWPLTCGSAPEPHWGSAPDPIIGSRSALTMCPPNYSDTCSASVVLNRNVQQKFVFAKSRKVFVESPREQFAPFAPRCFRHFIFLRLR